ncbi:MAG: carboxypeptidase regulatory-like domain-containing protein [Candidatus Ozemobacteraceae bacterium]
MNFLRIKVLFVLLLCLSGLFTIVGCFKGFRNFDSEDVAGNIATAEINGRITASGTISASVASSPSIREAVNVQGVTVWLQDTNPRISQVTDSNGAFHFTSLPFGTYRVVANLTTSDGRTYKVRSSDIICTQENSIGDVQLSLELANNRAGGILKDPSGNPIAGAILTLWGETFVTDSNGVYVSPPMPDSVILEQMSVNRPGYKPSTITVSFSSAGRSFQMTILKPVSQNINVPKAYLVANIPPGTKVLPSTPVNIWAVFTYDDGNLDEIAQQFELTGGNLSSGSTPFPEALKAEHPEIVIEKAKIQSLIWNSPSKSGSYKVSLKIWDLKGVSGVAQQPLNVWQTPITPPSQPVKEPPFVEIIGSTTAIINSTITFIASATDPDLEILVYEWTCSGGQFTDNRNSQPTWKAPSASGTYEIRCKVSQVTQNPEDSLFVVATRSIFVTDDPIVVMPGMISGHLLDDMTNLPIVGALVGISGTSKNAVTDKDGYFRFVNLDPGTYTLVAARDNYQGKTFPGIVVP